MILRRVRAHFRKQEWTAIALDFLIVVVGVYIGLQVNNWNAGRAFEAQERDYLAQLQDEIAANAEVVNYQIVYTNRVIESGKRALAFLESDAPCGDDCADLLTDFFHASQVWGTPKTISIFREMERLGLPCNAETRKVIQEHYRFMDGWDVVNFEPPAYRENVRGYFTPEASAAMWRDCYRLVSGELEELTEGCVDDLQKLDAAGMLQRIRLAGDLPEQLRFWIGQNIFALSAYPDLQRHAERATAAINEQLERRL